MKMMKIYKFAAFAAVLSSMAVLPSCEEFDPVLTGEYPLPEPWETVEMTPTYTIAELCSLYQQGEPVTLDDSVDPNDIIIGGKICTSDQVGNFYRSFYIQDGTAGIEIKMGKTGLYNEYKIGQTVYVKCKGLTLGMYGFSSSSSYGGQGMVQLGCVDPSGEYETSYIEVQSIIDEHIFKGPEGTPDEPVVLEESQLPGKNDNQTGNEFIGRLVTIKDLKYANEVFALLYINPNLEHKESSNRVFLSDEQHNITTWAMSEQNVIRHLRAGDWDDVLIGNSNDQSPDETVAKYKDIMIRYATPANVSQYFTTPGGTEIQIRTSGYCRFADLEIDPDVLAGRKTIDATGILTMYQGSIQFVLIDQTGIKVND